MLVLLTMLFCVALLIALMVFGARRMQHSDGERSAPPATSADAVPVPTGYRIRAGILTPTERCFYGVLCEATGIAERDRPLLVLASVRLAEIIEVGHAAGRTRSDWQTAFNRIASKQIDFIVCDADSTRPLVAIELDDRSHDRPDRRRRDTFLAEACGEAGLPLLRILVTSSYNAREIAASLTLAISGCASGQAGSKAA